MKILKPFFWVYGIYLAVFRERFFYVTGTGIDPSGQRMYFKTCLRTIGNIVPIKNIENKVQKELGLKRCIVLHFHKIPKSMKRHIDTDYYDVLPDEQGPQD